MRSLAVINRKGGVGKTTTTVNIGHALARSGYRVLLIDLDPQGHLAASLGIRETVTRGIDLALLDGVALDEVLLPARENLYLAAAGTRLQEVEQLASGGVERGRRLQKAIAEAELKPDFVLIDCPPSSGLLAVNALFAAPEVLVPVPGDYLTLHGLSQFTQLLRSVERLQQRQVEMWIALTRYHPRRRLVREVVDKLMHYFPGRILATPVRESAGIAECPSYGRTVFEYSRPGHGAEDYAELAIDLLQQRTLT